MFATIEASDSVWLDVMATYREGRRATRSEVWLTIGPKSQLVSVQNVSRHGLALAGAPNAPRGALCRIEKGPLTLVGTVRWRDQGTLGLTLAKPLSDRDAAHFGFPLCQARG